MVLFQIAIEALTNSRISANVPCPFYGTYKIKFLNYSLGWTTQPNILIRVNSQALLGNYAGGQLIVASNPTQYVVFNTSKYEFIATLNGFIDVDLTSLAAAVPANFKNAFFSFDIEPI